MVARRLLFAALFAIPRLLLATLLEEDVQKVGFGLRHYCL